MGVIEVVVIVDEVVLIKVNKKVIFIVKVVNNEGGIYIIVVNVEVVFINGVVDVNFVFGEFIGLVVVLLEVLLVWKVDVVMDDIVCMGKISVVFYYLL